MRNQVSSQTKFNLLMNSIVLVIMSGVILTLVIRIIDSKLGL